MAELDGSPAVVAAPVSAGPVVVPPPGAVSMASALEGQAGAPPPTLEGMGLQSLPGAPTPDGGPVTVLPPNAGPAKPKVLVVCDENLLFAAGIQEAYPDIEFTAATTLARQNLEMLNFNPNPASLGGRIRYITDPTRLGKRFMTGEFDSIMLFLPGLAYQVPRELGTADRPLFAFRIHWFVFHLLRHAKLIIKGEGGLHLVWPDEAGLMTSPCGAAGIEMPQLCNFCGCKAVAQQFDIEKLEADAFWPFLFGEVPSEPPEWLSGTTIQSFTFNKDPIAVPLPVALMLHPDVVFVSIKDPTPGTGNGPPAGAPLRVCLAHEAMARRDRLKEIYGPKESPDDVRGVFGLVPEPTDDDSLLLLPMEVFMLSLDDVPHICSLLKYQVRDDQPPPSIPTLDVLDPRLPSRIVRPPSAKAPNVNLVTATGKRKNVYEEWGGMKFFCPLTAICTMTADRMRLHMQGELYKRLASTTPGWEDSQDKKALMDQLQEAEEMEAKQKRARSGLGK